MKVRDRILAPIVVALLIAMIGPAAAGSPAARHAVGGAASVKNLGRSGVGSRLHPNGAIAGSPKLDPSISGSRVRAKR